MSLSPAGPQPLRAIWISDLHIGTPEFKLDLLVDFLAHHRCEILYLTGDTIDLRWIGRSRRWPRRHEFALQALLQVLGDTRVVVLPGNHDASLRLLPVFDTGRLQFAHEVLHEMADGRRLLVTHGDLMDRRIRTDIAEWKIDLACFFYYRALAIEDRINRIRLWRGQPVRAWIGTAKRALPFWPRYVERFRSAIVAHGRDAGADGVVCGHIHTPEVRDIDGFVYANTGDWVENCTALVETSEGTLDIVRWNRLAGRQGRRSPLFTPIPQ